MAELAVFLAAANRLYAKFRQTFKCYRSSDVALGKK